MYDLSFNVNVQLAKENFGSVEFSGLRLGFIQFRLSVLT